mgnify:CR=1 FL=1
MPLQPPIDPAVQRLAVVTCVVALLPISIGALVTTLKAGMAFADWPTSDGQNMLLYPWLNDLRHTDKFVEHGHRLAGVLIGLVSMALVAVTFTKEKTRWVRAGAVVILVAVIAQGLLGGLRVIRNEQVLAMTHSITGGLFFTLCFLFAILVRMPERSGTELETDRKISPAAFAAGLLLPVAVLGQYFLGGMFRHLGRMLHEHVAGAIIVTLLAAIVLVALFRSDLSSIRRRGRWLASALVVQLSLGMGSWVTKLGFPTLGWVATANSPAQNIICSLHTVGGMFLLATASAGAMELIVRYRSGQLDELSGVFGSGSAGKTLTTDGQRTEGGLA